MAFGQWLELAAVLVLLALSFLVSGAQTAFSAASRTRMHQLAQNGDRRARRVEKLTGRRERLAGALLLCNALALVVAAILLAGLLTALMGFAGGIYAMLAMAAAVVVLAQSARTLAHARPDDFALATAPAIALIVLLLSPFSGTVRVAVDAILSWLGLTGDEKTTRSGAEELRGTVENLHFEGAATKGDRDMLGGVLDLRELEVFDVMVHRTRMLALNADLPIDELVAAILDSPYTRVPLYRDSPDNIIGVVHAKDLLRAIQKAGGDFSAVDPAKIALKPWFVPDTTPAQTQLSAFLRRKVHFAIVVDEYGEVQGLVTLEDILEEIVGEIADEHDTVIDGVRKQADGSYIIDGQLPIRDLNRALDWALPDEEATTVAGLVIHEAKLIPDRGQQFTFHGLRFKVLRKAHNRITRLRVTPLAAAASRD